MNAAQGDAWCAEWRQTPVQTGIICASAVAPRKARARRRSSRERIPGYARHFSPAAPPASCPAGLLARPTSRGRRCVTPPRCARRNLYRLIRQPACAPTGRDARRTSGNGATKGPGGTLCWAGEEKSRAAGRPARAAGDSGGRAAGTYAGPARSLQPKAAASDAVAPHLFALSDALGRGRRRPGPARAAGETRGGGRAMAWQGGQAGSTLRPPRGGAPVLKHL